MPAQHRKIIHIDMDAFFAAVEQRDQPKYRNKPIIVGGAPDSRGVVATCSYQARKFGIHSAMSSAQAYRLCPQAIFIKPRFQAYNEACIQIRQVFAEFTDVFEPLSLDEAYLDVSNIDSHHGSATLIAKAIKQRIKNKTGLTASAGVSYNKFLAKIASDMDKPDGLYLISPEQAGAFIAKLNIGKFHGIGKATERKMHALGIRSGKDLKQQPLELLQLHFGKAGQHYYNIARGIDHRPVNNKRESKSIGVETTFQNDILQRKEILQQLSYLYTQAFNKLQQKHLKAQTLTIKIKYHDFVQVTRSKTLKQALADSTDIQNILENLLLYTDVGHRKVRLLGVSLSSFNQAADSFRYRQLDLFEQTGLDPSINSQA